MLRGVLNDAAKRVDCTLLAVGNASDHVHVIAVVSARTSVADLAQRLKGYSSFELNRRIPMPYPLGWQKGYFAESVSPTNLDGLIPYVRNQRVHHDDANPAEPWLNDD